jgi:hypothetical protein
MSSVQSYIKQQRMVYGGLPASGGSTVTLNVFTRNPFIPSDPNSTAGDFETTSNVTIANVAGGLSPVFRDMGQVIRSAGRTFRRVQVLTNIPATFGVSGSPSTNGAVTDYRTFWYEVSMLDGQGAINALFQIQG